MIEVTKEDQQSKLCSKFEDGKFGGNMCNVHWIHCSSLTGKYPLITLPYHNNCVSALTGHLLNFLFVSHCPRFILPLQTFFCGNENLAMEIFTFKFNIIRSI